MPEGLDEAKVQFGKRLFRHRSLSHDNSLSCASCHDVQKGGDDGRPLSPGVDGQVGAMNSSTVLNSVYHFRYFWDGRAATLKEQVAGPVHHPKEMASDWQEVVCKLNEDAEVVRLFGEIFKRRIDPEGISEAIAEYEKALVTVDSPFDRYLRGEADALSKSALRGYLLFEEMGCISCHQGDNLGANAYQQFGVLGDYFADRGNITEADWGRYNVTGRERDKFYFKIPSLRNIALTAPYFHDGQAEDLTAAIRVMAEYQLGLQLSQEQTTDLIEFLHSLTGSVREDLR